MRRLSARERRTRLIGRVGRTVSRLWDRYRWVKVDHEGILSVSRTVREADGQRRVCVVGERQEGWRDR